MNKLNNSNFESIEDIIKSLKFNYQEDKQNILSAINEFYRTIVGEKKFTMSQIYSINDNGVVIIVCENSLIANDLFLDKNDLIKNLNIKSKELGIIIKDIKFDSKKWKEKNNEKDI